MAEKHKSPTIFWGTIITLISVCVYFVQVDSITHADNATFNANISSANESPEISALKLNNNNPITLSPNTSTLIYVSYTVTDSNGCSNVFSGGGVTTTVYRTDQGSSCATDQRRCYIQSTTTYSCDASSTIAQATTSIYIFYFADATDASSSASSTNWTAYVIARDASSTTGSATSSAVELNTLTAIELSSSTFSYGTVSAGGNTSSTNQAVGVINAGNSSSSLQVYGGAMTSGSNTMPTSSQHYATSTFTYGGAERALSDIAATVSGFIATADFTPAWRTATTSLGDLYTAMSPVYDRGFVYLVAGDHWMGATTTVRYAPLSVDGSIGSWTNTNPIPGTLTTDNTNHNMALKMGNYIYYKLDATSTIYFTSTTVSGGVGPWATTTPTPFSVWGQKATTDGRYIYAGLNYGNGETSNIIYYTSSSPSGHLNTWQSTTNYPVGVYMAEIVINNGHIYGIGGRESVQTTTVAYAPLNPDGSIGQWIQTDPLPVSVQEHSVFANNNMIYSVGGRTNPTIYNSSTYASAINPDGSLAGWFKVGKVPGPAWNQMGTISLPGRVILFGGDNDSWNASQDIIDWETRSKNIYWGFGSPAGQPTGSYSTVNVFTPLFTP